MKQANNNPLGTLERVAIARAMGSADVVSDLSKKIAVGNYTGSVVIKVDYELDKGADYDVAPTSILLSKAVITRALVKLGAMREQFLDALLEAAKDAAKTGDKVSATDDPEDVRVKEQLKALDEKVIQMLPKASRSGATKVTATISKVEEAITSTVMPNAKIAHM